MAERIEDQLKKMIVERLFLKLAPEEIEDDKSLADTYGIDSVSILEMVVGIEELFGVSFDDEDFKVEYFETIASIADCIRGKMGREGANSN